MYGHAIQIQYMTVQIANRKPISTPGTWHFGETTNHETIFPRKNIEMIMLTKQFDTQEVIVMLSVRCQSDTK